MEEIMSMYGTTEESERLELNTKLGSVMDKIGARQHNTSFSYFIVKTSRNRGTESHGD
jgi:hypothetical protein